MLLRNVFPILIAAFGLALVGCDASSSRTATDDAEPARPRASTAEGTGDGHTHPETGPHGGTLVELGEEDYHAEVVLSDRDNAVHVYVLGSDGTSPAPISADGIVINLAESGTAQQFELIAARQEGDPAGKSSRFAAADRQLVRGLESSDADAQLVITIDGQQFRGRIDLRHEGHSH